VGVDDPYELVYTEAVRALAEQRTAVEALRTRAGILLSGAAITSSLLGRQAFAAHVTVAGWLALLCFLGLVGSLLAVLWPGTERQTTPRSSTLIESYIEREDAAPLHVIQRDLALHMEAAFKENETELGRWSRSFRRAALLFSVEVLMLIVDLGARS
jgi:hypothetical protein